MKKIITMYQKLNSNPHSVIYKFSSLIVIFIIISFSPFQIDAAERVSELGKYGGYSLEKYDQWIRVSQYITVRDSTKLAADIFRPVISRPTRKKKPVNDPLPVIWMHHRYQRDWGLSGDDLPEPWLEVVLKHGYVIASVDSRGSGASYGTRHGELTPTEARDAYDITEWFATQPWCNGKIGMYGISYMGENQFLAASMAPPHLKAIFPEMAVFDLYTFFRPGGVLRDNHISHWGKITKNLDQVLPARPVDEDSSGQQLSAARKEHLLNWDIFKIAESITFRDSLYKTTVKPAIEWSPSSYLDPINKSGIAVYQLAGWYDVYLHDALIWFKNLKNPKKIVIGPWAHTENEGLDLANEHLRWYDYWLKDIDNGVMEEAPIHYYTMGAPEGSEWRPAWQWPLPNELPTKYFFEAGRSNTVKSVNDGILIPEQPIQINGRDNYTVNYHTTSGTSTRWNNSYGAPFYYSDMTANDQKGLTYTTPPLTSNLEVTGHPVAHLWVASSAKDVDFFAYLEEVDPDGFSKYITEGVLRASHRALTTPSYEFMGLPFHRSFAADVAFLPKAQAQPVELSFYLLPTSYLFKAGDRIRVTITCADKDNARTPKLWPAPKISIYRNNSYASHIVLPVIPQR